MRHSQHREDDFIEKFFRGHTGVLLDIGANDGITISNSRRLMEVNWQGVFVEPSPKAFEKLKQLYEHSFNYAIKDYDGVCDFWESGAMKVWNRRPNDGLLSTTREEIQKTWKRRMKREKMQVQCKTFFSFLRESPFKQFDFITIDAEGDDFEILRQIPLWEIGCRLLCIEFFNEVKLLRFQEYLLEVNYHLVHQTKCNAFFAPSFPLLRAISIPETTTA